MKEWRGFTETLVTRTGYQNEKVRIKRKKIYTQNSEMYFLKIGKNAS